MLEKKIADELRNHEVDPQDAGLFEKIMQERGKRNSKTGFLLMGSIALMFTLITGLGLSNYWGKIPQDGYSKEQIAAIRKREAREAEDTKAHLINTQIAQNKESNEIKASQDVSASSNETKLENRAVSNTKNQLAVLKQADSNTKNTGTIAKTEDKHNHSKRLGTKTAQSSKLANNTLPTPIDISSVFSGYYKKNLKSDFRLDYSTQRVLKPLAVLSMSKASPSELLMDPGKETKTKKDESTEDAKSKLYALWPREINFFAGTYYNQRFINAKENSLGNTRGNSLRQKIADLEEISSSHIIGFNAEYRIKNSIFGQVGVQWLTVNQSILSHVNQTVTHRTETIIDPGGTTRVIDIYDTTSTSYAGTKNTNYFIEIPLTLGARWQIKRHIIQPQFGIISSFYNRSKGTAFNDAGELQAFSGKQDMLRNVNLQAVTGFTYTYIVGSRIGLYVQPNLRYGLTNQAKSSYSFSQYNSMIGGQFGLKYILK